MVLEEGVLEAVGPYGLGLDAVKRSDTGQPSFHFGSRSVYHAGYPAAGLYAGNGSVSGQPRAPTASVNAPPFSAGGGRRGVLRRCLCACSSRNP